MRDFYQHQHQALARTARLLAWLGLAVVGTVAGASLVVTYGVALLLHLLGADLVELGSQLCLICLVAAIMSVILMLAVSLNKMIQLRAGGRVIAEDLGGVLVREQAGSRGQRRLLNIVQEMAVASGIPTPAVYVLEHQQGINAFAAGNQIQDAVVAVTQGCLDRLNREQLQGVIAHEFSHILNGDMRLNIRLVGVLHGILGMMLFCAGADRGRKRAVECATDRSASGRDLAGTAADLDGGPAVAGRPDRHLLCLVGQVGRQSPARVSGGRLRRAVHTQPGRHRRGAQGPGRPRCGQPRPRAPGLGGEPFLLRPGLWAIGVAAGHAPTLDRTHPASRSAVGWCAPVSRAGGRRSQQQGLRRIALPGLRPEFRRRRAGVAGRRRHDAG